MNRIILYILFLLPTYLTAQSTNLSGFISTPEGAFVDNVTVNLLDDQGQLVTSALTVNGRYTFNNLPSGYEYSLQLTKGGHPLNGLSTFDFIMIFRHLLGIELLANNNQILAADIDGSQSISATDLVYLRQLILGIINELPQQRNWLFLSEDQTTATGYNTFRFILDGSAISKHFVILKIGDLNNTVDYE